MVKHGHFDEWGLWGQRGIFGFMVPLESLKRVLIHTIILWLL